MKATGLLNAVFVLAVVVAAAAATYHVLPRGIDEAIKSTVDTSSTLAGTLFGFTLTAMSILGSLWNRKLIENMRLTGHFDGLLGSLMSAGMADLATMFFGLGSNLVPSALLNEYFCLMVGFFTLTAYLNLLALRRFYLTLKHA